MEHAIFMHEAAFIKSRGLRDKSAGVPIESCMFLRTASSAGHSLVGDGQGSYKSR